MLAGYFDYAVYDAVNDVVLSRKEANEGWNIKEGVKYQIL
jgi:hypothetical protein